MNRLVFIIFIAAIFSGCSIKEVSKPIVKYTLEDEAKIAKEETPVERVLKIASLKSPKYIQNSGIWYERLSFKTNSYLYSSWNDDFVSLVEKNIANSIYESGLFKSMFTKHSKIREDMLLEGEVVNARQIINSDGSAGILFNMRLYLIDSKKGILVGSNEFKYLKKCESVDAKGAVIAYNEIVKNLDKDVVKWLKKLVKEN